MEDLDLIILRFERATDYDIGGVEAHGTKRQGKENIDELRSDQNRYLIGGANLREICDNRIVELQKRTAALRVVSFKKSRHTAKRKVLEKALETAGDDKHELAELVGWPWDPKNTKPWTQGVLSASPEFFNDDNGNWDDAQVEDFLTFAKAYLETEFGREVLYARADLDEKTPHVHFVVAPEHEERRTKVPMLSHSQHRLFGQVEYEKSKDPDGDEHLWRKRSYELFQDRVAMFAEVYQIDLHRGEQRAAEDRVKRRRGEKIIGRKHTSPAQGREVAKRMVVDAEEKLRRAEQAKADAERLKQQAERDRVAAQKDRETAARERAALDAYKAGLERGLEALDDDEIVYTSDAAGRDEKLQDGPNMSDDGVVRDGLWKTIKPAYEWLLGFARKAFVKGRELEKEAARNRAEANVLYAVDKELNGHDAVALKQMMRGINPEQYTRSHFPDAYRIRDTTSQDDVDAHFQGLPNLTLRKHYRPTLDAALLTEEHDPGESKRYRRAADAIEATATMRGFNLETGRQHILRATDPEQTRKFTDQEPDPIRIRLFNRQRQRTL
ncbi:plasmid recombination protein [Maritimibacter dapengensis]|uniref:Plasmid recombination protein n=1 Tax=Maritimibacter dapengensis TaxID=2836868 RepID=A0ABS6T818_9RHOB|nr:plasmid recombination protein [Maritimibacter dapengensis]MBV7380582.1 plasmid recombination protein [Maritimibacter dapengensis]